MLQIAPQHYQGSKSILFQLPSSLKNIFKKFVWQRWLNLWLQCLFGWNVVSGSFGRKMASVALLCLLLLERFLASDIDVFTEPVLRGLRVLEKKAGTFKKGFLPTDFLPPTKKLSKFHLYSPETGVGGVKLGVSDMSGFTFFRPERETKIIIHGFLDMSKIADWMHVMKDELLLLDHFNVIIVDWSPGNTFPYSQAAANTERVGKEIAEFMRILMDEFGCHPETFHLIGHSLGAHVAGHVGEIIKGLQRITGLDPATHLFSSSPPRSKLDRTDANFVDVIHTDGGGIGMLEPVGHVDFYPNGGEVQPGCTASNSLRSLIEKGVVEGVRNVICSHMRAPLLFTDSINTRPCAMIAYRCSAFEEGECDSCWDSDCALMGYHVDTGRSYSNDSKFYLLTAAEAPYCGSEYKLTLKRLSGVVNWLHVFLYGNRASAELTLEGKSRQDLNASYVVLSRFDLGVVHGAVVQWGKNSISRKKTFLKTLIFGDSILPVFDKIQVKPMKNLQEWGSVPVFTLCANLEDNSGGHERTSSTFGSEYC